MDSRRDLQVARESLPLLSVRRARAAALGSRNAACRAERRYTLIVSPTFKTVAAQALELPDEERGELAALLLESLDPDEEHLSSEDWDVAWSTEIDRRLREIREDTADLVDGEDVLAELRDIVDRP